MQLRTGDRPACAPTQSIRARAWKLASRDRAITGHGRFLTSVRNDRGWDWEGFGISVAESNGWECSRSTFRATTPPPFFDSSFPRFPKPSNPRFLKGLDSCAQPNPTPPYARTPLRRRPVPRLLLLRSHCGRRKPHGDRRAVALLTRNRNLATHQVHEAPGDGEADAAALMVPAEAA